MSHTDPSTPTRVLRRALCAGLLGTMAVALAVAVATPADAAGAPSASDPIGAVNTPKAITGGVRFTGWAADPDALTSNVSVFAVVDGRTVAARATTALANASVTRSYRTGPTPGFTLDAPVPNGSHTVCLVIGNIGKGLDTVSRCLSTPIGTSLTTSQLAAHDPRGAIASSQASPSSVRSSVRFQGWTSDPDYLDRASLVVLYLDGSPASTVRTTAYAAPRPAAAGYWSKFDITVPTSSATHIGCIWVVNAGFGSNAFLGCRATDNRSPGSAGPVATPAPAANAKIMAAALKNKGKPYSYGATGPASFDCSGLVQTVYRANGVTTPRVSQDQARAARLIPRSHAVAGDLVFMHDTQGDVYHVGIYVKPGQMFAAIDYGYGVNYQNIYDESAATYGSFTHT